MSFGSGRLPVAEQLLAISYRGVVIEGAYRLDLLVEDQVVVEAKAIEKLLPVHNAQLLSYLRLLNKPLGLLINFHVPVLVTGVERVMNGRFADALRTKSPVRDHKANPNFELRASVSPC
jgi:GxxExxY protein